MRIKFKRPGMKIQTKILLLFLASMITVGLVYFLFIIPRFIQSEYERIEKNLDQQMYQAEEMVDAFVAPLTQSLDGIAANLQKDATGNWDEGSFTRQVDGVLKKNWAIKNIFLLEQGQMMLARGDSSETSAGGPIPRGLPAWNSAALTSPNQYTFHGPYQDDASAKFYLTIAINVQDETDGNSYVLAMEVEIDQLAEHIQGPRAEIPGRRGLVLPGGMLESGLDGRTSILTRSSLSEQIEASFTGESREADALITVFENKKSKIRYYLFAHKLEQSDWILYMLIPERDLFQLVSGRSFPALIAGGMLSLVTLLFLLLVIQLLVVRPLVRLQAATSYIAQTGDLGVTLHEGSSDELGKMARSYNKMIREIKLHRENLEKMVEERTRELKKLSVAVEQNPLAIMITGQCGEVEYVNQQMVELSGYSNDELMAGGFELLLPAGSEATIHKSIERAVLNGDVWTSDMMYSGRGEREIWINCVVAPVFDEAGAIVHCVSICADITAQKTAYNALSEAKQLAEQAARVKSDFLANMSHEIRTPMNAIIGLNSLLEGTPLNFRQLDYVQKIKRSSNSLLAIINDILDFSKIEAGKLMIEEIDFNLDEVIENISNAVGMKAFEKGLELIIDKKPEVPLWLRGDPLRLEQVLLNIASNAVKFTEEGDVVLRIQCEAGLNGAQNWLRFEVVDTGIGMTKVQMEHLFVAFTQADTSTSRRFGGTGLGLAISHNLVGLMGGTLEVSSRVGEGSCFFFCLPLKKATIEKTAEAKVPQAVESLKIWIVEDNKLAQEVYANCLHWLKTAPRFFEEGEAALLAWEQACSRQKLPDVVILDYRLPGMNGVETWQAMEQTVEPGSIEMPQIMVSTAYGRDDVLEAIDAAGIQHILMKPVTSLGLLARLVTMVRVESAEAGLRKTATDDNLGDIQGAKILLIEDNEINQQVAREILENKGFWVEVANHGGEGLSLLQQDPSRYDLVLMDLQMPVMDGYEATREIRKLIPDNELPILALSADVQERIGERVVACGMQGYLSKPLEPAALFAALNRWIRPGRRIAFVPAEERAVSCQDNLYLLRQCLPSFDLADGLSRLDDNVAAFIKVLRRFAANQAQSATQLEDEIKSGRRSEAERTIHTLKGVAGSIGAAELSLAARELEARLLEEAEMTKLTEGPEMRRLSLQLSKAVTEIETFARRCPQQTDKAGSILSSQELVAKLEELVNLLEDYDTRAEDILAECKATLSAAGLGGQVEILNDAVSKYDFPGAVVQSNHLLELLTQ
jgi:PAS domain S-box-containing protein